MKPLKHFHNYIAADEFLFAFTYVGIHLIIRICVYDLISRRSNLPALTISTEVERNRRSELEAAHNSLLVNNNMFYGYITNTRYS